MVTFRVQNLQLHIEALRCHCHESGDQLPMLSRTALHSLARVEEHHTRRAPRGKSAAGYAGQAGIRAGEQRLPTIHKTIHSIAARTRGCASCEDRGYARDTKAHSTCQAGVGNIRLGIGRLTRCGTDQQSLRRFAHRLNSASFEVTETVRSSEPLRPYPENPQPRTAVDIRPASLALRP